MKKVAIMLAVVIFVLLGILIFVPAKAPEVPSPVPTVSSSTDVTAISPDGHVHIDAPAIIASPVTITGWVTGDGAVLGQGSAQVRGSDWTSTGTVPFVATVAFKMPHSAMGTVVFLKDNPSGLPQNDESFAVPVRFAIQPAP